MYFDQTGNAKISGKLLYTLSLTGLTTTLSETDLEEEIQDGAIKEDDNILYKDMYKKQLIWWSQPKLK